MSKQRYLNTDFWSDPFVLDHLDANATYLFIYLMTNDRCNVIGVYEISFAVIAMETKLDRAILPKLFKALESRVTQKDGWIVLHNSIKHQNHRSPKIRKLMADLLANVPDFVFSKLNVPNDLASALLEIYGIDMVSPNLDIVSQRREEEIRKEKRRRDNITAPAPASADAKHLAAKSQGFKKPTKLQYVAAVHADEALAKREVAARQRKTKTTKPVSVSGLFGGRTKADGTR